MNYYALSWRIADLKSRGGNHNTRIIVVYYSGLVFNIIQPILASVFGILEIKPWKGVWEQLEIISQVLSLCVMATALLRIKRTLKEELYIVNYKQMLIHFFSFLIFVIASVPTNMLFLFNSITGTVPKFTSTLISQLVT